ncbi:MAG TPA: hypothetical protein VHK90_01510 [Thermoanaerobaculia bacterium]|nr:hypothetical protein [Thermoanaerobaculia bacterium]
MQRIEISIKASGSEPLVLAFSASDTQEEIGHRLRLLTWLVGQLDGHAESRRRPSRAERVAPSVPPEPPVEA